MRGALSRVIERHYRIKACRNEGWVRCRGTRETIPAPVNQRLSDGHGDIRNLNLLLKAAHEFSVTRKRTAWSGGPTTALLTSIDAWC